MPPKVTETINEALLLDILTVYSDAEDKLLKAVAKRVAKGIKTEGWTETKLKDSQMLQKEIEKILGDTSKLSHAKVSEGIIEAYKKGMDNVDTPKGTHNTILDELDIPMNLKMQILATNGLLDNASFQVLRKASDAYQKVMAHSTAGLLAGADTRIQASQKMLNEFASKGITSFVDKAGRSWDLSSYAEMCTRTVSAHAALQGHIDRQIEVGEDLVRVSMIGTTCPICMRWQGVVLSVSGKHPKYHSVDEAKASGLFHPNCKHTLVMHIPELDGEGKVEPLPEGTKTESTKRYDLVQKQRSNERKIRYWKKRKALAITPEEEAKCSEHVKAWQYKNLIHCEKHGLRRLYAREGVMEGKAGGTMGSWGYGGFLKDYEEVYEKVVGEKPKDLFLKLDITFFGDKSKGSYEKWLRDEIASLDELDVDKAMMKDASKKEITPTYLYKKYIGDNPAKDYAEVSEYEKGTKEFKAGYAKWLKAQIEEIGVSYKIKPKYVEVHEDIPPEDIALSATEIYKKYHGGEKPMDAYKKLGGEEGTGMKYGKWVETQKRLLIRDGITKTVPFGSVTTEKTARVISTATETIEKAKSFVDDKEIKIFKDVVDEMEDPKRLSVKMREYSDKIKTATGHDKEVLERKYEILKERDLELLRATVKKAKKGSSPGEIDFEMKWLKEHVLDKPDIDEEVKAHVRKKYGIWAERKKELIEETKRKIEEEERRYFEAAKKKKIEKDIRDAFDKPDISNADIEYARDLLFPSDPDFAMKKESFDSILKERKKAADDRRKAAEEAEKRRKAAEERKRLAEERRKILAERGVLPRDPGASILDDLSDYYEESSSKQRYVKSALSDIASVMSYTEEEVHDMINDDLQAIFDTCEFGARIRRHVLKKVLSDNPDEAGFKNLFEVGTGGGCTNQPVRASGENSVFGYKGDASSYKNNKLDRPFYGMMMPQYSPESHDYYTSGPGRWYGDGITLVFDKALASNMSFTLGDSLDYDDRVTGCEAIKPEFRGAHRNFNSSYVDVLKARNKGSTRSGEDPNDPNYVLKTIASSNDYYLELQYHGHQTKQEMVDYITHVYIEGHDSELEAILDAKGIPYTIIK